MTNFDVLDNGVHHFPVIECECCSKLPGKHVILTFCLKKHGILDVSYMCLCNLCYMDYVSMQKVKRDE